MNFRTEIEVDEWQEKIGYDTPAFFIGSCFSAEIASRMADGLMPVLVNPAGVVYNPMSVASTLRSVISGRVYSDEDLFFYGGKWLNFDHYTDFSSDDKQVVLDRVNSSIRSSRLFLSEAGFLFVTFGTARIYRRADDNSLVANCHKIPSGFFVRELLSVADIVSEWSELLDELMAFNRNLKVVFTVSPVRHWKDGAHGNQISKSVLILAINELLKNPVKSGYFPSYELLLDDLRDYRFYGDDMLHPSKEAVSYIWNKFSHAFFDNDTKGLWREISAITRAARHRLRNATQAEAENFAAGMLKRIAEVEKRLDKADFTGLKNHFNNLHTES